MKKIRASIAALLCLSIVATANAHYLWISVERASGEMKGTNIFFEEAAKPGDGFYMDHFLGKSKVWVRTIEEPSPEAIEAKEVKVGDNRWMRVDVPEAKEYSRRDATAQPIAASEVASSTPDASGSDAPPWK